MKKIIIGILGLVICCGSSFSNEGNIIAGTEVYMADPTYDQTAKLVLTSGSDEGYPITRNFLECLKLGGDKIIKLEALPGESLTRTLDVKGSLGVLRYDVAYKMTYEICKRQYIKVVNIEIQRSQNEGFLFRLKQYQEKDKQDNKADYSLGFGILSYPNVKNLEDNSSYTALATFREGTTDAIKIYKENDCTILTDLRVAAEKIKKGDKISIGGDEISGDGVAWIRFFSCRYFERDPEHKGRFKYVYNGDETEELKRAISMMVGIETEEIEKIDRNIIEQEAMLTTAEQKGLAEGLAEGIEGQFKMAIKYGAEPEVALKDILETNPDNEGLVRKVYDKLYANEGVLPADVVQTIPVANDNENPIQDDFGEMIPSSKKIPVDVSTPTSSPKKNVLNKGATMSIPSRDRAHSSPKHKIKSTRRK